MIAQVVWRNETLARFFCAHFLPRLRSWLLPSQPFLCPWMRVSTVKKRNWHWTCRHRASWKKSWQWRPWSSSVRDNSSQLLVWQQNMLRHAIVQDTIIHDVDCSFFKIACRSNLRICILHLPWFSTSNLWLPNHHQLLWFLVRFGTPKRNSNH